MRIARVFTFGLVVLALSTSSGLQPAHAADETPQTPGLAEITVGIDTGDIQGRDQRALQMAVDYVARLGGGTVRIAPGRYEMRNALAMRDNVRILGAGEETILAGIAGRKSPLAVDGDCNERQVTLKEPEGFQVGDGIAVADDENGGGFEVTTATLTEQLDESSFRISAPLYLDYMVYNQASARQAFPIVAGTAIHNAVIEGVAVEGHLEAQPLDGCRGAGIYLFECEDVIIRNCTVRNYPGDGISFQVSQRITVEDCTCERNTGLGLHPGSGSQHPVVRRNIARNNGGDGLFVCWRVKHGVFEQNQIEDNSGHGISIGHKDSDNIFQGNRITGNGQAGILFREESEPMGAHRNRFEKNTILDNGLQMSDDSVAAILIRGHHHGLVFRNNKIGWSARRSGKAAGIQMSEYARELQSQENEFQNVAVEQTTD